MIDVILDKRSPLQKDHIVDIVELIFSTLKHKPTNIHIEFVDKTVITDLNKRYRNINTPTDVISLEDPDDVFHEVYICSEIVRLNSEYFQEDYKTELLRTIIHGVLHTMGFDHKQSFGTKKERMFIIQEKILSTVNKNK